MRNLLALALALAGLALALAACGGGDEPAAGEPPAAATPTPTPAPTEAAPADDEVALASPAGGGLLFEPERLRAQAGRVAFVYDNPSEVPHAVAIDGIEGSSEVITSDTTTWTVELEPGEYTFYCPVGGHREGGMEGTLTVR